MASNLISTRVTIDADDGWVRLSETDAVALLWLRAAEADAIAVRQVGSGTALADCALLPASVVGLSGVNLAELEIATESETDVALHVLGYTRR